MMSEEPKGLNMEKEKTPKSFKLQTAISTILFLVGTASYMYLSGTRYSNTLLLPTCGFAAIVGFLWMVGVQLTAWWKWG